MKKIAIVVSLIMVVGLGLYNLGRAQIDDQFTFDENAALVHQDLVLACAVDFTLNGFVRAVTLLHIQHQGASNLDSAGIHDFAERYLSDSCAGQDCADPVVQIAVCAQLVTYAVVPF